MAFHAFMSLFSAKFYCEKKKGNPEQTASVYLALSCSQSQRCIWLFLPAHGAGHLITIPTAQRIHLQYTVQRALHTRQETAILHFMVNKKVSKKDSNTTENRKLTIREVLGSRAYPLPYLFQDRFSHSTRTSMMSTFLKEDSLLRKL